MEMNAAWLQLKNWPSFSSKEKEKNLSIADLFSGCGGLTLGVIHALLENGIQPSIEFAIDSDLTALQVYRDNFDSWLNFSTKEKIENFVTNSIGTVPSETEEKLLTKLKKIDIVLAGPPCQGHSDLNNSSRRSDPRNRLYLNAIRFVELFQPKVALIENVSTVVHDKESVVRTGRCFLESIGYVCQEIVVDTSEYGLPQRRRRHLLIATEKSRFKKAVNLSRYLSPSLIPISDYLQDIIDECISSNDIYCTSSTPGKDNQNRMKYLFENNLFDLPNEQRPPCHRYKKHSYNSMYGRLHWNKPAQTITGGFGSMGQGRYVHPNRPRTITPHEAARIQGFPDFFRFNVVTKRGPLQTMIGNAVPPKLSALVINELINSSNIF